MVLATADLECLDSLFTTAISNYVVWSRVSITLLVARIICRIVITLLLLVVLFVIEGLVIAV